MFSVTHSEDGTPIMRESKLLKVGIGLPRGKALNVWITVQDGKRVWKVVSGYEQGKMQTWSFATRQEAEACYNAKIATAPICKYPRKISFFTFSRSVMTEDGETFVPDFAAIEANGPTPTEIDIILFDDNPFTGSFQMWSTTEKKCQGDGINALRVLSMAPPDVQKELKGEKYFPIVEGCWTRGCEYANQPKGCKPSGDLKFQLASSIRLGGTAYFHTTGFRSISQIFSSLERIKMLTRGRMVGLPLKATLKGYKVKPAGAEKSSTQYGVSLELRAEDMEKLKQMLFTNIWESPAIAAAPKMIEEATFGEEEMLSAKAITDEWLPEATDDVEEQTQAEPPKPEIAKATEAKTDALADKLKAKRAPKDTPTTAMTNGGEKTEAPVATVASGGQTETRQGSGPTREIPPATSPGKTEVQPGVIPPATYNRDDLF